MSRLSLTMGCPALMFVVGDRFVINFGALGTSKTWFSYRRVIEIEVFGVFVSKTSTDQEKHRKTAPGDPPERCQRVSGASKTAPVAPQEHPGRPPKPLPDRSKASERPLGGLPEAPGPRIPCTGHIFDIKSKVLS